MSKNIHVHLPGLDVVMAKLDRLELLIRRIIMTQAEQAARLNAVAEQLVKVSTEVQALKDAVANTENVDPALQEAIDRVVGAVQVLDEMNPDVA